METWEERLRGILANKRKVALGAKVEEFYNETHVQSGVNGGQFTEGKDGPGRKRDPGKEDLGVPGSVGPKGTGPAAGGGDEAKRQEAVKAYHAKKDAENVEKAKQDESKGKGLSQDLTPEHVYPSGLKGKLAKALDNKSFEKDLKDIKETIRKAESAIRDSNPNFHSDVINEAKTTIARMTKDLAETEARHKVWRKAHYGD